MTTVDVTTVYMFQALMVRRLFRRLYGFKLTKFSSRIYESRQPQVSSRIAKNVLRLNAQNFDIVYYTHDSSVTIEFVDSTLPKG